MASLRPDDGLHDQSVTPLAHLIWAMVHGVSMLAIDGQLGPDPSAPDRLIRFAVDQMHLIVR